MAGRGKAKRNISSPRPERALTAPQPSRTTRPPTFRMSNVHRLHTVTVPHGAGRVLVARGAVEDHRACSSGVHGVGHVWAAGVAWRAGGEARGSFESILALRRPTRSSHTRTCPPCFARIPACLHAHQAAVPGVAHAPPRGAGGRGSWAVEVDGYPGSARLLAALHSRLATSLCRFPLSSTLSPLVPSGGWSGNARGERRGCERVARS